MVNLSTIDYDQPIENLIAGLNDTGHITHSKWKKTCVTFHHNGGRLSHQGVLNVWKVRPASAHFDVDATGAVAQYANAFEYAWACGNTVGNQRSISIEMCNKTLSPTWDVAEVTWKSAARLAAWLFVNIIGEAPSASNVLFHHDWLATACAGPYMDGVRSDLLAEVQTQYRAIKSGNNPVNPPKPTPTPKPTKLLDVDGYMGQETVNRWAAVMGTNTGRHDLVVAVQEYLNRIGCRDELGHRLAEDGVCDLDNTAHATKKQHTTAAVQRHLGVAMDGSWWHPSTGVKALQRALNKAKTGSKEF